MSKLTTLKTQGDLKWTLIRPFGVSWVMSVDFETFEVFSSVNPSQVQSNRLIDQRFFSHLYFGRCFLDEKLIEFNFTHRVHVDIEVGFMRGLLDLV